MRKPVFILAIILLLCVFAFSAWKLWTYFSESTETQSDYNALSQLRQEAIPVIKPEQTDPDPPGDATAPTETEPDPYAGLVQMTDAATGEEVWMRPEFCSLFAINPDIIGWISIEGTHVDYPVVHRPENKDYYLYRTFHGKQLMRGCIYAREECDVLKPSDNITIYGHMMQDNTMFADLRHYTDKAFWEEHKYIRFDTLRQTGLYEVICVFKTSATRGQGFSYHLFIDFKDQDQLDAFWSGCQEGAFYDTCLTPTLDDKLITLSTCEYTLQNGRLVVVARRVSD